MPRIAREAIATFKEENRTRYLNTLFRLKMVAQDYAVEWHEYPMAHAVCAQEITDIRKFLSRVLP